MRAVPIKIHEKPYELVFSNRVLMRLEKEKLDPETNEGMITMLSAMMEAGDKLARLEGREPLGFLTVDDIADTLGPDDILLLTAQMQEAQTGERNVETADDPKNAESAPPDA